MWNGDYKFLLKNLILKDFRIRYRNMSLGVFWSLLNPLVMMGVLTFVFTKIFPSPVENFPIFVLTGIVSFNFYSMASIQGTAAIVDNLGLIKRVPVPREVIPISAVLSIFIHTCIQLLLLLALVIVFGKGFTLLWMWLIPLWVMAVIFCCGFSLLCSSLNVYIRDTRYAVESLNTVLFWLVPIFYPITLVPEQWRGFYLLNPIADLVVGSRNVLLDQTAPAPMLLISMVTVTTVTVLLGWLVFRALKPRFYNYL
jgi:ABC-type polysaccharide/polyol phosphate export permease